MPFVPGYIIEEQKRRDKQRREQPAQVPLYIDDRQPPPGWNPNGEPEKPKNEDGEDEHTISMI